MHEVTITAADTNRRLDKFLLMYLNNASRSFIYKLLRKKRIKLNSKRALGGELLQAGDVIGFYLSPETLAVCRGERVVDSVAGQGPAPPSLPAQRSNPELDIIFEDEYLLVVNKPAGMPSHGGMKGKDVHLLSLVLHYLRQTGAYPTDAAFVPALCNRLDVNTSGLVVCGKNYQALRAINALFADASTNPDSDSTETGLRAANLTKPAAIEKEYLTVVDGQLSGSATLDGHYYKDTATNTACVTNATCAPRVITAYKSLAVAGGRSLLSVSPITGRSHQIRAHLAAIGHPLSGDRKYGGKPTPYAPAQLLHCKRMMLMLPVLSYPTGTAWVADLPDSFQQCVQDLFSLTQY